jgi:hypothetical protein
VRHHRRRGPENLLWWVGGEPPAWPASTLLSRAQQSKAGSLCLSVVVVVCESVPKQLLLQQAFRYLVVLPLTLFVKFVSTLSHSLVIGIDQ